jgi:putative ABC transport system permease protein
MNFFDILRVGTSGLLARKTRAALSAVGIAIGIATVVAVTSIPASSKSQLLAQLAQLGNLVTVQSGQSLDGSPAPLPHSALAMIRRIPPVQSATAIGVLNNATVRRSAAIPSVDTGGIAVVACDPSLLATLDGTVQHGTFLNAANARYPAVVLGRGAAQALGVANLARPPRVYIGDQYFRVVGVLNPFPLSPEIDDAALIGVPAARSYLGFDGYATQIYVRAQPDQVIPVQHVLAAAANPESPEAVRVSRPSDAIAARAAAKGSLNGLLLGLGLVALLVGGIGIANVMVISVIERRTEIGVRRALGASRLHIAEQFLTEALVLSTLGGVLGIALGTFGTVLYADATGIDPVIPIQATVGALAASIVVGAIAGLYPAVRASQMSPTVALRSG